MKHLFLLLATLAGMYLFVAGKPFSPAVEADTVPVEEPVTAQPDILSEWEVLQLAIAYTESRFRPDVVGKAEDYGVYQITPVYVREINRLSGKERFCHDDALDLCKSVEMFNVMQDFKNPGHDRDLAIRYHNRSKAYYKTVLENYEMILRYEELRRALRDYEQKETPSN